MGLDCPFWTHLGSTIRNLILGLESGLPHTSFLSLCNSLYLPVMGFPGGAVVKNLPANAGDTRDSSSIPRSGRSPGDGNSSSLQYSYLENSMDRGAWWATVHKVTKRPYYSFETFMRVFLSRFTVYVHCETLRIYGEATYREVKKRIGNCQ